MRVCTLEAPERTYELLSENHTGDTVWFLVDDGSGPEWIESSELVPTLEEFSLVSEIIEAALEAA